MTALTEGTKQSREERKLVKKRIMKQMSPGKPNGVLGTISGQGCQIKIEEAQLNLNSKEMVDIVLIQL